MKCFLFFMNVAMENWGLVTYREEYLLYDETIHSNRRKTDVVTTIAHEFGHQWFGDLVSPKWVILMKVERKIKQNK